jgi:hypothetical protein
MAIEAAESEHTDTSTDDEDPADDDVSQDAGSEGEEANDEADGDEDASEAETTGDEAAKAAAGDEKPKGLTVTLSDDEEEPAPPPDKANKAWAEHRKKLRALERENEELKAQRQPTATVPEAPTLPPRPKMSDPDIEYDEEKLTTRVIEWGKQRDKVEAHKEQAKVAQQERAREWEGVKTHYQTCAAAISEKVSSYPDAEKFVMRTLTIEQQNHLLEAVDDPAKVVLALSQNPDRAKDLAAIKSLPKFTRALVELEKTMIVTPLTKKPKAGPEKTISSGGGSSATSTDKTLERLEAEADRTGNRAAVQRYKAEKAEKQKKK